MGQKFIFVKIILLEFIFEGKGTLTVRSQAIPIVEFWWGMVSLGIWKSCSSLRERLQLSSTLLKELLPSRGVGCFSALVKDVASLLHSAMGKPGQKCSILPLLQQKLSLLCSAPLREFLLCSGKRRSHPKLIQQIY